MTFNSVSFFAFFPLAVLVCRLVPRRWQNAALLAVQILSTADTGLRQAIKDFKKQQEEDIVALDREFNEGKNK